MFQKNKKIFFYSLIIFLFFSLFGLQIVHSIGLSGGPIVVDDAVNGVVIVKKLTLKRTNTSQPTNYKISADGEVAKFIKLDDGILSFPAGAVAVEYLVNILPINAANGTYTGTLRFESTDIPAPGQETGAQLSLKYAAASTVSITVIDREIKKMEISDVGLDVVEENNPIVLNYQLKNSGNVDIKPDKIEAHFVAKTDDTYIVDMSVTKENLQYVPPGSTLNHVAQFDQFLERGEYRVDVDFFLDGKMIHERKGLYLEVLPEGSLAQSAEFIDFQSSGITFEPNSLIKFTGILKNDGKASIQPLLYIGISQNGSDIDLLRSEKKYLRKNEQSEYVLTTRLENEGEYKADAYFEYGPHTSAHKVIDFVVEKKQIDGLGFLSYIYIFGILLIVSVIILIIVIIIKKKHKKGEKVMVAGDRHKKRVVNDKKNISKKSKNKKK